MNYELLTNTPLFRGLSELEIKTILSAVPFHEKKFSAGTIIAQSGETVSRLMIVTSGTAKGEMVDYAGRVIKIEDIPAPNALASAFMFGPRNVFPVNVISVTDTRLLVIEKNDFLKLMMTNDHILVNFLNMISGRSQFLSEKIKFLNFRTIKGKLAQYILHRDESASNIVRLDRTQNDLADFFGVTRPSIARAIGEMEKDGLIKAEGKNIVIINRKDLAGLTKD
jgi:CRP/FNR family transcriptional regulator, dissimilatory nitrate respiration regulator